MNIGSTFNIIKDGISNAATSVVKTCAAVKNEVRTDIDAIKQRDPAATGDVEVLLLYSGLHALLAYRVSHKLYLGGHKFSARAVSGKLSDAVSSMCRCSCWQSGTTASQNEPATDWRTLWPP